MRLLVTGGSGFIGKAVERAAKARGYEFNTFDHPSDVRSKADVWDAVFPVDGVINLAGILGTAETLDDETDSIDVNINGALNVARACQQLGTPLVQIGTGHRGQLNVYAVTKACAEDLILTRAKWSGLKANVVRAFHAYGPGQKAPAPYGRATVRKIIPSFVCAALASDPLIVNGTGMQQIDLVHVDDVAATLLDALQAPYGRTLEAGTGTPVTVLQAAHDVIAACNSNSPIELVPMRAGEPIMSTVVATNPASVARAWPSLVDTIDYYQGVSA
jgi:nucleoside-diphosphate-sugar epimerase